MDAVLKVGDVVAARVRIVDTLPNGRTVTAARAGDRGRIEGLNELPDCLPVIVRWERSRRVCDAALEEIRPGHLRLVWSQER